MIMFAVNVLDFVSSDMSLIILLLIEKGDSIGQNIPDVYFLWGGGR